MYKPSASLVITYLAIKYSIESGYIDIHLPSVVNEGIWNLYHHLREANHISDDDINEYALEHSTVSETYKINDSKTNMHIMETEYGIIAFPYSYGANMWGMSHFKCCTDDAHYVDKKVVVEKRNYYERLDSND